MTDTTSAEAIGLEQRATDPRLESAPAPEPVLETPVVEPTSEEPAEPVIVEPVEVPKPRKTAEEVLKGRVGHLTKTLSAKDEALAAAQARADAAEALLASSQRSAANPDDPAPTPRVANGNTQYTQAEFDAAVTAHAEAQEFNRKADEMYNTGASKFTDWKDAVETLVVSGFMNKDLIDSAMAVDDGPAVLHHLGTNLDEAERINALPPIQKVAALAKLSNSLAAPRSVSVSSAPTPIKPVSGSPSPQLDLQRIADEGDMSSYLAARAKQGSRWAQGRR